MRLGADVADARARTLAVDHFREHATADRAVRGQTKGPGLAVGRLGARFPRDPQRAGLAVERLGLPVAMTRPGADRAPDHLRLGLGWRHLATAARSPPAHAHEQQDDYPPCEPVDSCACNVHDRGIVAYGTRFMAAFELGAPDPKHISTSWVERVNWSTRTSMRRYTRLSNGFSRKLENHEAAVALNYFAYNFIKIYWTLRVTPAMAAKVTNRLFDLSNIVALLEAAESKKQRRNLSR